MVDNLRELMQKAKEMQTNMQAVQKELETTEIEGAAGAGMVRITMRGDHNITSINIEPSLLQGDPTVLADLLKAAFNDAVNKVKDISQQKVAALTQGLQLPEEFDDSNNADDTQ